MATTNKAPTSLGGAGRGISNHLHAAPIPNPKSIPMIASVIFHLSFAVDSPVGPPQCFLFLFGRWPLKWSTKIYPTVIATTSNAPTITGGAGTGIPDNLQIAPIEKASIIPSTIFILIFPVCVCVKLVGLEWLGYNFQFSGIIFKAKSSMTTITKRFIF